MSWCVVEFPGVLIPYGAEYTLSHGIQPGVATVECAPIAGFGAGGGNLVFRDLDPPFATIVLWDCKVDRHSIRMSADGRKWILSIWDRRWKWQYGGVSGKYNFDFREGPPKLDPNHEQTPQQLAILCLLAMGEVGFDVLDLPNASRPPVDWDHRNPAQALAELAESLGCVVVLQLDNTVALRRVGAGAALPIFNQGVYGPMQDTLTIDPPERPDGLLVVGRLVYQEDFELEAIGQDTDGEWKPIEELSYTPVRIPLLPTWTIVSPPDFYEVLIQYGEAAHQLAQQTVYKYYRIKKLAAGLTIGGVPFESLEQILPIFDTQVAEYVDEEDLSKIKKRPALVYGTRADLYLGYQNRGPIADYWLDFHVDTERGVVVFADYVYKFNPGTGASPIGISPGDMFLRTSVSIRHPENWAWMRYERFLLYPPPRWGTGFRILEHPEIVLEHIDGTAQNQPECDQEADYWIAGADQDYLATLPQERTWQGLMTIPVDGAIRQVSWRVSNQGGAQTTAARNNEFSIKVPPYPMRRIFDYLRGGGAKQIEKELERGRQGRSEGRDK